MWEWLTWSCLKSHRALTMTGPLLFSSGLRGLRHTMFLDLLTSVCTCLLLSMILSFSFYTHTGTIIYTLMKNGDIFCAHNDLHSAGTSYLHTVGNDIVVRQVLYICRFNSTGVWFWIIWSDVSVSPPGFWAFLSDSPEVCSCHRWTSYGCSRGLYAAWCTSHWPPWRTTKE